MWCILLVFPQEAAAIAAAIREVPWQDKDQASLLAIVAAKVAAASGAGVSCGSAARRGMQDFRLLRSYFSAQQWLLLQREDIDRGSKLELLVERAGMLGCRTPSEGTFQALAALYLASVEGLASSASLAPSSKHDALVFAKSSFKRLGRKLEAPASWVSVLPENPADYKKAYPKEWAAVFGAGGAPVECPYDIMKLDALMGTVPMRRSNKARRRKDTHTHTHTKWFSLIVIGKFVSQMFFLLGRVPLQRVVPVAPTLLKPDPWGPVRWPISVFALPFKEKCNSLVYRLSSQRCSASRLCGHRRIRSRCSCGSCRCSRWCRAKRARRRR